MLRVKMVELDTLTDRDWEQIIAGERHPWGGIAETLEWREKTHHFGVRDANGALVALGGLVLAEVSVEDAPQFQVAGVGNVIVTRAARGRGLARLVLERLLQCAGELDVERAMLFCLPANIGLYTKFGFQLIPSPVWVPQPSGLVQMPLRAMWKPLSRSASWPPGKVELLNWPF